MRNEASRGEGEEVVRREIKGSGGERVLVAMERAGATSLSSGPPGHPPTAEGGHPVPMGTMYQSQGKRQRPPSEAEQVRATPVAPRGPWPRPHHKQQLCLPPQGGGAAVGRPQTEGATS
eukprot:scaffold69692_cov32-Tisochrysis_lutea.AAC.2